MEELLEQGFNASDQADDSSVDQEERFRSELDEANRRVLMAQAEIENSRKRMRRDYEDQLKYASLPLLRDTLAVLDNLRRALDASKSTDSAAAVADGVAIVAKQLEDVVAKHHCRPIPAEGELFDPNFHEAISQMPSPTVPEGVIAHVAVVGYQLHDRVVRPSQVIVSTGAGSH
jgi:molecular chaperone GrpE